MCTRYAKYTLCRLVCTKQVNGDNDEREDRTDSHTVVLLVLTGAGRSAQTGKKRNHSKKRNGMPLLKQHGRHIHIGQHVQI